jgi:hypothetical protein
MAGKLTLVAAALAVMVSYGMSAQVAKAGKRETCIAQCKKPSRRLGESGIAQKIVWPLNNRAGRDPDPSASQRLAVERDVTRRLI